MGSRGVARFTATEILAHPFIAQCLAQSTLPYYVERRSAAAATYSTTMKLTSDIVLAAGGTNTFGSNRSSSTSKTAKSANASGLGLLYSSALSSTDAQVATGVGLDRAVASSRDRANGIVTGTCPSTHVSRGARNFNIVDKAVFSSYFWNPINKPTSNGNEGAQSAIMRFENLPLDAQFALALEAIAILNSHRRQLASSVYLLEGWEQCVTMSVIVVGRVLSRTASSPSIATTAAGITAFRESATSAASSFGGQAHVSSSALFYERDLNLRHYYERLLFPTLEILQSFVHECDSGILEHLTSSVFMLVNGSKWLISDAFYRPTASNGDNHDVSHYGRSVPTGEGAYYSNYKSDDSKPMSSSAFSVPNERQEQGIRKRKYDRLNIEHMAENNVSGSFGCHESVPAPALSPSILERLILAAAALHHAPIQPVHAAMRLRGFAYSSIGTFWKDIYHAYQRLDWTRYCERQMTSHRILLSSHCSAIKQRTY